MTPDYEMQPTYDPNTSMDVPPTEKSGGCMRSCLIVFVLFILFAIIGAVVVYYNLNTWMVIGARAAVTAILKDSQLPEQEKQAIVKQTERVIGKFGRGEMTWEQLIHISQHYLQGPLPVVVAAYSVDAQILGASDFEEEQLEKGVKKGDKTAEAHRVLQRLIHGLVEGKISKEEALQSLRRTIRVDRNGRIIPYAHVRSKDLRATVRDCRDLVNRKNIPDRLYHIRISELLRKEFDKALGENTAPPKDKKDEMDKK